MSINKRTLNSGVLLVIVFLVCVFLLGIIKIEDYDAWTHLSLGRVIFENQGFPEKEPFSYPSLHRNFADAEWLFDLVFYMAYALFNLYGVILLKAAFITATFYVLLKDSLLLRKEYIASVIVLIFIVFMTRHRFVERPDIAMMFFLSFAIYALNSFVTENKKYIYLLPLTQIIWVNMHPSVTLVIIPFCAFLFGGVLHRIANKQFRLRLPFTPSNRQLLIIGLIFLVVLAASLLGPYAADPFAAPVKLVGSSWYADEITELQKPAWETYKMPYLLAAAIAVSFLVNIRNISLIHLFLVIPFIYFAFSGIRFMFIMGIVGAPVIVRNIAPQFAMKARPRQAIAVIVAVCVIIFTSLAWTGVTPFALVNKQSGFGINYDFIPEGALNYLDKRKITGRIFNTYHWGGYITWRDFPVRSSFVDGRGAISRDLLESLDLARVNPAIMDKIQKKYGFNIAILNYPDIETSVLELGLDRDLSLSSEDWALVYWDDLSMVYLKRGEELNSIIERDEYRYVKPVNGPSASRARLHEKEFREGLINDLKRNIQETRSYVGYALLGFIYNDLGLYNKAIDALSRVKDFPFGSNLFNAYNGMAYAYSRLGQYDESLEYYEKAFDLKKDASIPHNIGLIYIKRGDELKGAEYLEKALEMNRNLVSIYPTLIGIYRRSDRQDKLENKVRMFRSAERHSKAEEHFQKGLKAYMEQDSRLAIEEYKKSIASNPSNPAAFNNLGYIYFDLGLYDKALMYQKKAVDLDLNYANAHYGLALIYKKWGDREMAKKHWQEYLRIEPRGYYSRRAKKELLGLQSP
ncbi:MAG TPA: tetratricopeptide repeat protein [Nitrospirae bacterium]|nr:photosystem I assembly protein Ycf3 [bacterium BMS3Abin10]GBE39166.1 photosystem I assembly protein Ycf3 [bacterium BMS3Bbin08]HDK81691.1 tetratricopeptide repeat protein [Nitrospirota bacterium]HDO26050.1 tetratricopeptide repeat protein [Nitrospirota bacterium]